MAMRPPKVLQNEDFSEWVRACSHRLVYQAIKAPHVSEFHHFPPIWHHEIADWAHAHGTTVEHGYSLAIYILWQIGDIDLLTFRVLIDEAWERHKTLLAERVLR